MPRWPQIPDSRKFAPIRFNPNGIAGIFSFRCLDAVALGQAVYGRIANRLARGNVSFLQFGL
jgi:hypothetical protein